LFIINFPTLVILNFWDHRILNHTARISLALFHIP